MGSYHPETYLQYNSEDCDPDYQYNQPFSWYYSYTIKTTYTVKSCNVSWLHSCLILPLCHHLTIIIGKVESRLIQKDNIGLVLLCIPLCNTGTPPNSSTPFARLYCTETCYESSSGSLLQNHVAVPHAVNSSQS